MDDGHDSRPGIAMINSVGHIAIRTRNLERSLDFYTRILGLQEAFRLTHDDGRLMLIYLSAGNFTFIELFPPAEANSGTGHPDANDVNASAGQTQGFVHLCLHVDDINKTIAELKQKGLPVQGEPIYGKDGNFQFWITDPDGNRIELMQIMPDSLQSKYARG